MNSEMNHEDMRELSVDELEQVSAGKGLVKATAAVNIYAGPGTDYKVVGKTVKGNVADKLGEKTGKDGNRWIKVGVLGKVGWVNAKYVKKF